MKNGIKNEAEMQDRTLEMLSEIDDSYLSEALELHCKIADAPRKAKSPALFVRRFSVVAACLLIVAALVPLAFIISETLSKKGAADAPTAPDAESESPSVEDSSDSVFGATLSYAGYTGNIADGALNLGKLSVSSVQHLPIYKVESVAELDTFKQSWGLNFDQDCSETPTFNSVTSSYSDEFFAENTLLVIYVSSTSGSYRYGVWDVYIDGGDLCVHVERTNDKGPASDDMAGWFITLEIPDKMLEGVTSFDADLNNFK